MASSAMKFHTPFEETLPPDKLRQHQAHKLQELLREVLANNAFYRAKLSGAGPDAALESLPFTTRSEVEQDQLAYLPYGSNLTYPRERYCRMHQTSGSKGTPLRWLDTAESWAWWLRCWGVVFRAAGVTEQDRLAFLFSFGPFVGFWSAFESAFALGNFCLPAGGMTTQARIRYVLNNEITVVCCTPTYALRVAEVAAAEEVDLHKSPVRTLIVAGEPGGSVNAIRRRIEAAWGARVIDHAGMTEVGAWGFECSEVRTGLHILESEFIAEVINPANQLPVAEGQEGELVLTNLGRTGSPLIRYRTGDRVRLSRGQCACGRWFVRAEGGVLGRVDDMLVIRGNNVFPAAIEAILREFDEVAEFRLRVIDDGRMDELRVDVEPCSSSAREHLGEEIVDSIRHRLHFRPIVTIVEPGSLPRFEMKADRVVRVKVDSR